MDEPRLLQLHWQLHRTASPLFPGCCCGYRILVRSPQQPQTAAPVRIGAYLQVAVAFQQRMLAVVGTAFWEVKVLEFGILKLETI